MEANNSLLPKGTVVAGRYRIEDPIAAGGMGQVYEALDLRIHRKVALKTLHAELSGRVDVVARFRREAMAASIVDHDGIVMFTDCGYDSSMGIYYLCSERLKGDELRTLMKAGKLTKAELFEILIQVCRAVGAAHEKNVVHRDLKPENIFVTRTQFGVVAKVLDFGIAKLLDQETTAEMKTRTNVAIGTPGYMSPEQFDNHPVDAASDVFALGCILYEALTGRPPFDDSSLRATMIAMMNDNRAPLEDQELETIVKQAVRWDHDTRTPSAQALATSLEAYQRRHPEVPWVVHQFSIPSPTPVPATATVNQTAPEVALIANIVEIVPDQVIGGERRPTHISWSGETTVREPHFLARHTRGIAAAGAAMILLAVAILAFSRQGDSRRSPPTTRLTTVTAAPTPTPMVVQLPNEPTPPAPAPPPSPQPPAPSVAAERPSTSPHRHPRRNARAPTQQIPIPQRREPTCEEGYRYNRERDACCRRVQGASDCDGEIER